MKQSLLGKILTWLCIVVLSGCCCATGVDSVPVVAGEVAPELVEMCLADYRETYLKGRPLRADARIHGEYLSKKAVLDSKFATRLSAPLTEPAYVTVTICNLPPRVVGGSGHYLVSPLNRKIIARYHSR
ncbi:MAG: hypothetical protein Q4F38_03545 [Akkermansia sp.]|nr:hypothetical protein [Akkermansia sp.]